MVFDNVFLDKWNERLKKFNLFINIEHESQSNIISLYSLNNSIQGFSNVPSLMYKIPEIHYTFNFLVSKKCSKRFYEILQNILNNGLKFSYKGIKSLDYKRNLSDFKIEKSDVKIHNVEYIQNHCKLNCEVFEIIYFVNSVEIAVETIDKYFEYLEDGTEICKTKFKVSEIVSTKEDKSGNYMVMSFLIKNNKIYYKLSKIQNDIKSEVIIFDGTNILSEEDILKNREYRLDILLNN
jgi:hypothetical protein